MPHVLSRPELHISVDNLVKQSDLDRWPHLKEIALPNVNTKEVHLLIGQDNPTLLTPQEVISDAPGSPYATKTILGWTLNGPLETGMRMQASAHYIKFDADNQLQQQVEKFWKLDDTADNLPSSSVNDKKVIALWEQSLTRGEGHYSLDIPFKFHPPQLPNNRSMAEHRLRLLGKRLSKDNDLKSKYTTGIVELQDKKYAERVPIQEINRTDGYVWYLPHHPVVHPRKPDKVRIVFDCAAKFQGTSLNENVHQGPDLASNLVGVLLRFRQDHVAFMADVEGMYHQVLVTPKDRDVLRFLWWEDNDPAKPVQVYRMRAHLFGGIWSSSCANFALKRAALDFASEHSIETVNTILNNFYVDDCLKSVENSDVAIRLVAELRELLAKAGFRLTKWISSSRKVLSSIPESELSKSVKSLDFDHEFLPAERALGVLWNIESDAFGFDVSVKDKPLTRRGLLSIISSIYDPLGFVSPFILVAKILFQTLCRDKIGWDDPMPMAVADQWKRWLQDLPLLARMVIPRCLKPITRKNVATVQLHHFSDASEVGYGAVSFARIVCEDGQIHCCLLMSKSRLAPLKTATIPRLELAAAVVSVRLDQIAHRELNMVLLSSMFWTDSTIVLHYVHNEDKRFQTFVANRITKIREHTSPSQWRHIDTNVNPADDVSRGVSAQDLIKNERWICGPFFLWKDEAAWPTQPNLTSVKDEDLEVKKDHQVYNTQSSSDTSRNDESVVDTLMKTHSTWYGLRKAVAWILRVKAILRHKTQDRGPITVVEMRVAEKEIVRQVQASKFGDSPVQTNTMRKLIPQLSLDGLLCVGGRLRNAPLREEAKHPWILPGNHPVVDLIIRHFHVMTGHSGVEYVLAEIRQRFWIINGRSTVKRVVSKCIPCRKQKAPLETQYMADLPTDRVTPGLAPFTMVGVDFFGPITVKRGRTLLKRYGCIFTCLTTRAVHVEVCQSLETDSFINALHRFISRRGKPSEIRSDNGSNLVGAEKELRQSIKEWNKDHIQKFLHQKEISWIFNPPTASHMGGVWERQIRTVRSVLRSVLHEQVIDDEGLVTLMCIVEMIVNGRPITKLSDDPRDAAPLTPNHLLLLREGPQLPPGSFVKQDVYRKRWRQIQYLADLFWHRWVKEYLPLLQARQKWLQKRRDLQVGDLVLIKHQNTLRHQWPLGLVTSTYPGSDGHVRSVQVRIQGAVYDRPIHKLCLLEGAALRD